MRQKCYLKNVVFKFNILDQILHILDPILRILDQILNFMGGKAAKILHLNNIKNALKIKSKKIYLGKIPHFFYQIPKIFGKVRKLGSLSIHMF